MKSFYRRLVLASFLLTSFGVQADLTCNNSNAFAGGIVANICWTCFFPMELGSVPIGGGTSSLPRGRQGGGCLCPGRLGIPTPGVTAGMWQPTHLIELTRKPWCSPTLGGATLSGSTMATRLDSWGGYESSGGPDYEGNFYNFHLLAFPVGQVLDVLQDSYCTGSGIDIDLLYVSEIDPTWNNDILSLFTTPEAALFATPPAIAACLADAGAGMLGKQPIEKLYWCAGTWGHLYPFAGRVSSASSGPEATSLAGTRGLAALHRRGILKRTMGSGAVCKDRRSARLPKSQYKLGTFFPLPERADNHWIGESTFRWGEWRSIPGVGEDFVYTLWTYQECCVNL